MEEREEDYCPSFIFENEVGEENEQENLNTESGPFVRVSRRSASKASNISMSAVRAIISQTNEENQDELVKNDKLEANAEADGLQLQI